MIEIFLLSLNLLASDEALSARQALLRSNEVQRRAHLNGDAELLVAEIDQEMTSVSDGAISSASREAILARFRGYFAQVRYRSWDDMRPPLVRIADDGSIASVTVQKLVELRAADAEIEAPGQFVQFAWEASYRRADDGRWLLVANTSTRKPLSAEEAAAARVALSHRHTLIAEPDLVPEGVAFDARSGITYVSSTYRRKIVAVGADGTVRDFKGEAEDGLWSTLGMEVDEPNNLLWVISANLHSVLPMRIADPDNEWRSELLAFDLDSGRLIGRHRPELDGQVGLNDVTVTDQGRVFVTESVQARVLELDRESGLLRELALSQPMVFPNGITHDEVGALYVSHQQGLRRLDPESDEQHELSNPAGLAFEAFDGLAWYDGRLIGNQPQRKRIIELTLSQDRLSVQSQRILEANHPAFDQPSTGEVALRPTTDGAPASFVYLANAQMHSAFQWRDPEGGVAQTRLREPAELEAVLLLEVPLTASRPHPDPR